VRLATRGARAAGRDRLARRHDAPVEIHGAVRETVGHGRPLYAIDRELLEALEPDLILTLNLCMVCAFSSEKIPRLL
jgi:hypothetical protein